MTQIKSEKITIFGKLKKLSLFLSFKIEPVIELFGNIWWKMPLEPYFLLTWF